MSILIDVLDVEDMSSLLLLIMAIAVFLSLWYALPFVLRKLSERRLARLCRKRKAIVLSYDDGPSKTLTPRLLDLFAEKGVQATFFVIGKQAEIEPNLVQRAIQEGHEVGSHTYHHFNAWKAWPLRVAKDIGAGTGIVKELGGNEKLFRPPYGKQTIATMIGCFLNSQQIGWWTIDSRDARSDCPRFSEEELIASIEASGGGVVLAHDFERGAEAEDGMSHEEYVVALTSRIIEFAHTNGYIVMRLSEVLRGARA